jgi:probable FeS assembly SUF system protein SufT
MERGALAPETILTMTDTIHLTRDCDVIAVPSGRRETLPKGASVRIVQQRGGAFTVSNEIHAIFRIDQEDADALGLEFSGPADTPIQSQDTTESLVWDTLKTVYDPELPVNIVDLGLVYSVAIAPAPAGNSIAVRMAMTSPGCGMSNVLKTDVESKLLRLPQVAEARVEVVFDPPWNPSRMSEAARLQLGMEFEGGPGLIQIGGPPRF